MLTMIPMMRMTKVNKGKQNRDFLSFSEFLAFSDFLTFSDFLAITPN